MCGEGENGCVEKGRIGVWRRENGCVGVLRMDTDCGCEEECVYVRNTLDI